MSLEEHKTLDRRFFEEIWNRGDLAVVDELFSADYKDHDPTVPPGIAGFKQFIQTYRTAFPDVHFTIRDQIAEGDKVVSRWTAKGTHTGALMNIPPTGKFATITGIDIRRYADGKAVEGWSNFDTLGMFQQIGVIPSLEQSS